MATKIKKATGDCFERSFHLITRMEWKGNFLNFFMGEPKLCQGVVWHKKRGYHHHGWVEDNVFAYDFIDGKLVCVTKDRYYAIGKIEDKPGLLCRYTKEEAVKNALEKDLYYFSELINK